MKDFGIVVEAIGGATQVPLRSIIVDSSCSCALAAHQSLARSHARPPARPPAPYCRRYLAPSSRALLLLK